MMLKDIVMRTTLTIDDDLFEAIEHYRQKNKLALRAAIDRLLRSGIGSEATQPQAKSYSGPVFDSEVQPGIDPNRLNQLVDELESEAFQP